MYQTLKVNEFNKDLGQFNMFPNELFFFLCRLLNPKDFLSLRNAHPVIGSKFSKTAVINHFYKKTSIVGQMHLFDNLYKSLTVWGVRHMVILGYRHVHKAIKFFVTRNQFVILRFILDECSFVNISFENNFVLRWAFRKNNVSLIQYICSRSDFDLSVENYSIIESLARYFTWNKYGAMKVIMPIHHSHLMIKFFRYACKYNNEVVLQAYSKDFYKHDLEEDCMIISIRCESLHCLAMSYSLAERSCPDLNWIYSALNVESFFSFKRLLELYSRDISNFDQNQLLVHACIRRKVLFLKEMKSFSMGFASTFDLIGVYAISIIYKWTDQFEFLLKNYPLDFENYQVQWLLFFCVNVGAPSFFHDLVTAGCKPIPIELEHVKEYDMEVMSQSSEDEVFREASTTHIIQYISKKREEYSLTFNGYYVFFCQKLFYPALQDHISFIDFIINNELDEKDEEYFLQFEKEGAEWEHFNVWLEETNWLSITKPSPAFSHETMFNISFPNIEHNSFNPVQKFFYYV